MRKAFQTFITQGYGEHEMFTGVSEHGDIVVSELPVNLFTEDVTEDEIIRALKFAEEEEQRLFIENNKLITVTMQIS